ncbi:histidine kinase [Microbacterium sp. HD4P20]|uniref:sensor histidine kinase n=1 Tax=Microbacterium sp. HD4P20 TaxID=2864874 RepID=UPI001C63D188|nr:histidine kinase [Microbacterium sp. HD4P20]MCP2638204.1 histidine kinase [Microbacterium sp. HD4P20]
MRASTVWQALMLPPWRLWASRWPWAALVYVLTSALLSLALVPVLLLTLIALPLWAILVGALDRTRLRLLGVAKLSSGHVRVPHGERRHWLGIRLTERATWRETSSMIGGLAFGAAALVAVFTQAITAIVLVVLPFQARVREIDVSVFADIRMRLGPDDWWLPLLLLPVFLALAAYVNAGLAAAQGAFARWLLAPRTREIDARVAQLTRSRAAIVAAHASERRRIERDLHDGVQQELVGIAARLGILEIELAAGDVDAARGALTRAQDQTDRALGALRETVRGIHPAVLTDHGLAAALDELPGRAALPVRIEGVRIPRLRPDAEAAAYFFVAEAVTNAAKHTTADRVIVRGDAVDDGWIVSVADNGHGGADPERGTGLRGIIERAEALDAAVHVRSPAGGPTEISLHLPGRLRQQGEGASDADTARR